MARHLELVTAEPEEGVAERTESGLVVPEGTTAVRRPTVLDEVLQLAVKDDRDVPCGLITHRVHPYFQGNEIRFAALVADVAASVPTGWSVAAQVIVTECPRHR